MFRTLLSKELSELAASRATWLLLLSASALVIHAFSTSTALYAEASGATGAAAALAQGLNPLDGIVVPVLGVYDLVATLLLPFVVIRLFSSERANSMQAVVLQLPTSWRVSVLAKVTALLILWAIAGIAGALALAAWLAIGGHVYAPEVFAVALGHVLRGAVTIGIGAAVAAFATSPATASLVVLAITIGSWALDFVVAARGGMLGYVAQFTPTSALRLFERAEIRAATVLSMLFCAAAGVAVAIVWMQQGHATRHRVRRLARIAVVLIPGLMSASRLRTSADVSEDRRSSFTEPEEAALRSIKKPMAIEINLAAQDPRLADYERGVLAKLRRTIRVDVSYVAKGRTGLFEAPDAHYGEIAYDIGGHRVVSRSVSEPIVVETILGAAGIAPPTASDDHLYAGYPLAASPSAFSYALQLMWPLLIIGGWWRTRRAEPAVALSPSENQA